jgi:ribosomal protein S18 acetylase RimI-like enzyme
MSSIEIIEAELNLAKHQRDVLAMVDAYAQDPMGNGRPLSPEVREALIPALKNHPTTLIFLAYEGDAPCGVAVCFLGFSTFAAKPLVNIHDLAVLTSHRGRGVGRMLLEGVEKKALELGCCKLTLEVQANNHPAQGLYQSVGFAQAEYTETAGAALFYAKPLG